MNESVAALCPKRMHFGPCGGVRPDGECEMRPGPCAFPDAVAWTGPVPMIRPVRAPLILTDFSCAPFDPADLAATAATLGQTCDAVLVGEHQNRPDFPPTLMSQLLLDNGATPWITLSCRDRNRIVLEQELRGLALIGVRNVLCVTGDGRAYDVRPDVTQTFDLDGPRLVALAASLGMTAAVPETPDSATGFCPALAAGTETASGSECGCTQSRIVAGRSGRVHESGAVGGPDDPGAGCCCGLDRRDVRRCAARTSWTGARSRGGERHLTASDPVEAGIEASVTEASALLSIEGIEGVNISGLASSTGTRAGAEIKAEVGARIRAERQ